MLRRLTFSLVILLSGCGYTFVGSGTILPPDVKNIYIPTVQNLSAETSLTTTVTEALQEQFEKYGAVNIVDTEAEADAILQITIKRLGRGTRTSSANTDTALQLDSSLNLSGTLTKKTTAEKLWEDNSIKVTRSYGSTRDVINSSSPDFVGGGLSSSDLSGLSERELSRGQEKDTLITLAELAAKKIYEDAVAADF
jgi:outer membrane lipopolysaccharide assembly protein LptE/RlpB